NSPENNAENVAENLENEIQRLARSSAEGNREKDALARRDMLRQMHGAQIATVESLNGSLGSRAGNVIDMMTKMPLIMLVISTIAVLNTMVVSVFTRRWEMGVLRACGVTRGGLIRLILAESVLIGCCAIVMSFLFGVFYSWLLIHITSMFGVVTPPLIIPWSKVGFGFGFAVLLCVAASIYPAFQIGLREPVELLRRKD
ncbi:MAG: FtsX-like permease family protein, partial [Planctomycetia bacterium]|nr:FtsX-like permease family protein [Planctomycetia bacterium]